MAAKYQKGRYRVRIVEQGFSESKEKGTPYFYVRIVPIGMYDPATPAELVSCDSYERFIEKYITQGTVDYVIADLQKLGFEGTKFSDLDPANEDHVSFVGMEIDAVVTIEQYEGKDRDKWNWSLGGRKVESMDAKSVKSLDTLFGQKLKAANKGNGNATSKPAKKNPVAAEVGDEVPF